MNEDRHPPDASHPRSYRIGLVEDHEAVVLGLATTLSKEADLELVATAGTVDELIAQATALDLAILDLRLADGSSPSANVETLRGIGVEVLIYTGAENPYLIRSAARAGVLGVVRKSDPMSEVVEAIRVAASGQLVASTDWAAALDSDPALPAVGLSPRQRQLLALYASGEQAADVAALMHLSLDTVNDYLTRIRHKYAAAGRPARSKTDLYIRAVEDGWLPMPGTPGQPDDPWRT